MIKCSVTMNVFIWCAHDVESSNDNAILVACLLNH